MSMQESRTRRVGLATTRLLVQVSGSRQSPMNRGDGARWLGLGGLFRRCLLGARLFRPTAPRNDWGEDPMHLLAWGIM